MQADTGLAILLEMLGNVDAMDPMTAGSFYSAYYLELMQDVLAVLTDTFHQPGFPLQAASLQHMFHVVVVQRVGPAPQLQEAALREHVRRLLTESFRNVSAANLEAFTLGLFRYHEDAAGFKVHLRDFLVTMKEFSDAGTEGLFVEDREAAAAAQQAQLLEQQRAVPGLLKPHHGDAAVDAGFQGTGGADM